MAQWLPEPQGSTGPPGVLEPEWMLRGVRGETEPLVDLAADVEIVDGDPDMVEFEG